MYCIASMHQAEVKKASALAAATAAWSQARIASKMAKDASDDSGKCCAASVTSLLSALPPARLLGESLVLLQGHQLILRTCE